MASLKLPHCQGVPICSQAGLGAADHTWDRRGGVTASLWGDVGPGFWVLGVLGVWVLVAEEHLSHKGAECWGHLFVERRALPWHQPLVQGDEWSGQGRGHPCAGDPGVTLLLPVGCWLFMLSHTLATARVGGTTHETQQMGIGV